MEKLLVRGVAKDDDVARIALIGLPDEPGIAFRVFRLMAQKKINVDIILQSIGREDTKDISFTIPLGQLQNATEILEENKEELGYHQIMTSDNFSKISIVGAGMQSNPGVAAKMFEALFEAGVNIHMISTSEIKISVLINRKNSEKALVAVHDAFDF